MVPITNDNTNTIRTTQRKHFQKQPRQYKQPNENTGNIQTTNGANDLTIQKQQRQPHKRRQGSQTSKRIYNRTATFQDFGA